MKFTIVIDVPDGSTVSVSPAGVPPVAPSLPPVALSAPEGAFVPPFADELIPLPGDASPLPGDPIPFRGMATAAPSTTWQVGQVHAQGHNPLRQNSRGLFCPTKLPSGGYCEWRP